MYLYKN